MSGIRNRPLNLNMQQVIDRIVLDGKLSRQEYFHLTTTMLSEYHITDEERRQLNRIFDSIQMGQLKFSD